MTVRPKRRQEIVTLLVVFLAVLVVSALIVYSIGGWRRTNNDSYQSVVQNQPVETNRSAGETRAPTPSGNRQNGGIIDNLFGTQNDGANVSTEGWAISIGHMTVRFMLAALLGAALAFRPRKRILVLKRNPYVAQTQILLAIVAAALMIIVGDNAARAFGIFAAVSLVRFRTNIKDPKEITRTSN